MDFDFSAFQGKVLTEGDFVPYLEKMLDDAKNYVYFASAWVKGGIFRHLVSGVLSRGVSVKLVVRGSEKKDFEITDPAVFDIPGVEYAYHPKLHAKMIIVDGKVAMLGSANITYSGLTSYGNREVAILIDNEKMVSQLTSYYETIWEESYVYSPDLIGIVMNPSRSSKLEVLLLKPSHEIPEGTLLIVPWDDGLGGEIILRVDEVIAYNTGFFMNPFSGDTSHLFPNAAEITFVNDEDKPHAWRVGALLSYVEKSSNFYLARCSVLGVHRVADGKERLEPLFSAPPIGLPVYKDSTGKLSDILKKDMGGGKMDIPIKIGKIYATDIPIHIDVSYLLRKDRARHMAILGTTGSGKSYFAQKILIPRIVDAVKNDRLFPDGFSVIVIDPHGEWSSALKDAGVSVKEAVPEEYSVPLDFSEDRWKDYFVSHGVKFGGSDKAGKHNKRVFWEIFALHKKGGVYSHFLKELSDVLGQMVSEIKRNDEKVYLDDNVVNEMREELHDTAQRFARDIEGILEKGGNDAVVVNLRKILDGNMRCDIVGAIANVVFQHMKTAEDKEMSTLMVVEEAHNFAPEKGYGDVVAGKDNSALTYISKVAAEGRKFGMGLVIITQRPASVNKYVLSQMGTYAIFRLVNKNDLDAVMSSVEYAGADVLSRLPSLKTGMALLSGLSLPFPVFVDMRKE